MRIEVAHKIAGVSRKKLEKLKTKIAYLEKEKTVYELNRKLLNTLPL